VPSLDLLDHGDLYEELIAYCGYLSGLLVDHDDVVDFYRRPAREFNATVETDDARRYSIFLYDGLLERARATILAIESEEIHEEICDITRTLIGDATYAEIVYRVWLVQVVVFVALHELAHVACGHVSLLRSRSPGLQRGTFAFVEVPSHTSPNRVSWEDPRTPWVLELEADEFALQRMLVLAHEMFSHDTDAKELLDPSERAGKISVEKRRAAEQLVFYSACTALALIEIERVPSPEHPPAFLRVLHMGNIYFAWLLELEDVSTNGPKYIPMTDMLRQLLSDRLIPSVVSAMTIVDACCRNGGIDLRERFGDGPNPPDVRMADDVLAVVTNREATTLSAEATEYVGLRSLYGELNALLEGHHPFPR